jgi:hypothetical protein
MNMIPGDILQHPEYHDEGGKGRAIFFFFCCLTFVGVLSSVWILVECIGVPAVLPNPTDTIVKDVYPTIAMVIQNTLILVR